MSAMVRPAESRFMQESDSRLPAESTTAQKMVLQGGQIRLSVAARPRTAKNSASYFDRIQSQHGSTTVGGPQDTMFDRTDHPLGYSNAKKTTMVDYNDLMRIESKTGSNQLSYVGIIQQSNQ